MTKILENLTEVAVVYNLDRKIDKVLDAVGNASMWVYDTAVKHSPKGEDWLVDATYILAWMVLASPVMIFSMAMFGYLMTGEIR